jgi:hypothetical protein
MKRIGIHQPNFMPWIGWWHKAFNVDRFIILGDVPFSDSMYIHRTRIRVPRKNSIEGRGWQWLTIPVKKSGRSGQLINQVELVNDTDWRDRHVRTLHQNYRNAPYFDEIMNPIQRVYEDMSITHLSHFNLRLITAMSRLFKLVGVDWHNDWEYGDTSKMMRFERLLALCRRAMGSTYLSGKTGLDQLPMNAFKEAGIELEVQDVDVEKYPQVYPDFITNLSGIDLLFNLGPQGAKEFLQADSLINGCHICDINEYRELQSRLF